MKRMVFALVAILAALGADDAQAQEFQVVVHPDCSLTEISAGDLSRIFKKKSDKLPSGESAKPVDQGEDSVVREAFSEAVHGRSSSQIESFWQQQIFAGKDVPPEKKDSDAAVLSWVQSTPGAIGYVSAGADVAGVKVLKVVG